LTAVIPAAASARCGFGDVNAANANVAIVQPVKLHFVEDNSLVQGCPNSGAQCQEKGYVIAGDSVLTGNTQGAYVCAGYVTSKGSAVNAWLPADALKPAPAGQQNPEDWAGKWSSDGNDIVITSEGDGFHVQGEAEWQDGPAVHTGELDGVIKPGDGVLAFTMGDDKTLPFEAGDEFTCRVSMVRRGPYLLVKDNDQCGGANVTFSGFYGRDGGTKQ
jgi:hypothetical protein